MAILRHPDQHTAFCGILFNTEQLAKRGLQSLEDWNSARADGRPRGPTVGSPAASQRPSVVCKQSHDGRGLFGVCAFSLPCVTSPRVSAPDHRRRDRQYRYRIIATAMTCSQCSDPATAKALMRAVWSSAGGGAMLLWAVLLLSSSGGAAASSSSVLVWGPGWSRRPPRMPLSGLEIGGARAGDHLDDGGEAEPFAIWENFAEIPRAVELWAPNSGAVATPNETGAALGNSPPTAAFFADTQGSLFLLQPGVAVHELIPRDADATVDRSILSLAYSGSRHRVYYTVNTTLMALALSPDATKPVDQPKVLADFAPSGVQNLVVDWKSTTAYFCLFDGPNRTAGSLVRAPLDEPKNYEILINSTLSTLSGRPFGDALPRYALDLVNERLYFVIFAVGVRCASPALAPLSLIFSYKSEKSLCTTAPST